MDYVFIDKLKDLHFINEIWLFGSRARGDHHNKSDIDLAIISKNCTEEDWGLVTDIIEDADTLLKIDCIRLDKEKISEELYDNILKDKKVIYVKS